MNWKLRLQNPTTLTALIAALVAFIYQVLSVLGITAPIDQSFFVQLGGLVVTMLVTMGVIVDPTTKGIEDSSMALSYETPNDDKVYQKNFTESDIEKFLNTTEEHFTGQIPKNLKFIRLKGHTIYWGAQKPTTAKKGDYFLDQMNNDLIYQFDGEKWETSNMYAIVKEGF